MKRIVGIAVLFLMAMTGCKNEKTEDGAAAPKEETLNHFRVILDVVAKKDDTFSLFYTTDGSTDFSKIPVIWKDLKGSDNTQQVTFDLPDGATPTQLRLDFGVKKEQEPVAFKKITIQYHEKTFSAEGANVFKYFRTTDDSTVDVATGTLTAKVINGEKKSISLYPSDPLATELNTLAL